MQNNAHAVSSFTLPPDLVPSTAWFGQALIVVWQNVDVPRTVGEEGWNVPPTAGFIFRDLANDRPQDPISLDVEITDSEGNVVTQITEAGTYTATVIAPETLYTSAGEACWIDYSGYKGGSPKSVTFTVTDEYQIVWSHLNRTYGQADWRQPPVAKVTIQGVTYELGVNLKYKGNPIDPADIGFDNPQFDFHGGSDDPTWTAVADIDSLAGRLENYQNYNIVNTEAHYDYTWLTINVMTYGAEMYQYGGAAANQNSAKIQRTYGDPLNLVGTVAS